MIIKPFKLERYYTIHEFTAKYPLCSSDCEAMTVGDLLSLEEGAADHFNNHWLGYTETKGNPSLRKEIASTYTSLSPEEILVCAGAQEPIFLFSQAVLEAGDEVIVQFPCYQSVESVPESMGCKVLKWTAQHQDNKFVFDLDELAKLINSRTKVIYLNSPNNPTGYHFSKEEQLAIVELARKYNCIIFSDEVYAGLEQGSEYVIPAFADIYEYGISLNVMSKAYGLAGLRIGWLATKQSEILEKVAMLKEYTSICSSAPSEFLAGVALRNRKKILERNLEIVRTNLKLLEVFFAKHSSLFSWHQPVAGPVGFVKMNFEYDDLQFAEKVVQEKNVLLLPGDIFDYRGYFRLGFGRKNMPEALAHFEEFVIENLVK